MCGSGKWANIDSLEGRQQLPRRAECNNQSPPNLLNVISLESLQQKPFFKAIRAVQRGRELLKASQSLVFSKLVSWKRKIVSWKGKLAKVEKVGPLLNSEESYVVMSPLQNCKKQTQEDECGDFYSSFYGSFYVLQECSLYLYKHWVGIEGGGVYF